MNLCDQESFESEAKLFQKICQQHGSAEVVALLVRCFGAAATAATLENLDIATAISGEQLIKIYSRNREVNR